MISVEQKRVALPSTYSLLSDCFKHVIEHGSIPRLDGLSDEGEAAYNRLTKELDLFFSLDHQPCLQECYQRLLNRITFFINKHYEGDDLLLIYEELEKHPRHASLWGME